MSVKLNIVADAHIWAVHSAFTELPGYAVDLQVLENKQITAASLKHADVLLTRSSTCVNAELLGHSAVRFAATATVGDDHYDKAWLDAHAIVWANAAGSSTASVLEYMVTVLLDLHVRQLISIEHTTIGIIGAGRIGGALALLCKAMGIKVLLNDPPKARQTAACDHYVSLDELLDKADLLTLHTPLIHDGEDNTVHLLSHQRLKLFKGKGVINAARGRCVDNVALCDWLDKDDAHFAVLDCWEHEPAPLLRLMNHPGMVIATPHIAGHSVEGKAANTLYIYHALCRFLEITPIWDMQAELPEFPATVVLSTSDDMWHSLHAAVTALYPIRDDHDAMQSWSKLTPEELARAFVFYRRNYPARRFWQHAPITIEHADASLLQMMHAIGLKVV